MAFPLLAPQILMDVLHYIPYNIRSTENKDRKWSRHWKLLKIINTIQNCLLLSIIAQLVKWFLQFTKLLGTSLFLSCFAKKPFAFNFKGGEGLLSFPPSPYQTSPSVASLREKDRENYSKGTQVLYKSRWYIFIIPGGRCNIIVCHFWCLWWNSSHFEFESWHLSWNFYMKKSWI